MSTEAGLGSCSFTSLAKIHGGETTINELIGSEIMLIAQAVRLIRSDGQAQLREPQSALVLAEMLEATRERCSIACTLMELALERIGADPDHTSSPRDKVERAMLR